MTPTQPLSILIIDDEIELAALYRTYLESLGFDAISFTDPFLALEYYKYNVNRFTFVLTDLRMPQMSGIELACKIRELNCNVKIFLITAFVIEDFDNSKEYADAKIELVIQKPVHLKTLKQYLDDCCDIQTLQLAG